VSEIMMMMMMIIIIIIIIIITDYEKRKQCRNTVCKKNYGVCGN